MARVGRAMVGHALKGGRAAVRRLHTNFLPHLAGAVKRSRGCIFRTGRAGEAAAA